MLYQTEFIKLFIKAAQSVAAAFMITATYSRIEHGKTNKENLSLREITNVLYTNSKIMWTDTTVLWTRVESITEKQANVYFIYL